MRENHRLDVPVICSGIGIECFRSAAVVQTLMLPIDVTATHLIWGSSIVCVNAIGHSRH